MFDASSDEGYLNLGLLSAQWIGYGPINQMRDSCDKLSRQFPMDLAIVMGFPVIWAFLGLMMLKSAPFGWLQCGAVVSMAIALAGGVWMTVAKWPIYMQRRFFNVGAAGLPEAKVRHYGIGLRTAAAGLVFGAVFVFAMWFSG